MHAACPGVQSRANVNACTDQPSGTLNLATITPGCDLTRQRAPGRRRDADPAPGLSHAIIMPDRYDIPPPPGQPGRKLPPRLHEADLHDRYEAVSLTVDHYCGNSSNPLTCRGRAPAAQAHIMHGADRPPSF